MNEEVFNNESYLWDFINSQIAEYEEVNRLEAYNQKGNVKVRMADKSAFVDCKKSPRVVLSSFIIQDLKNWYIDYYKSRAQRYIKIKLSFGKLKKIFNLFDEGFNVFVSAIAFKEIKRILDNYYLGIDGLNVEYAK